MQEPTTGSARLEREAELERTSEDPIETPDGHATLGGAVVAGAATGGAIGLGIGPVGAAVGAFAGALVGAATERLMHGEEHHEDTYVEESPRD